MVFIHPKQEVCSDPKDEHQKLRGGTAHLKPVFLLRFIVITQFHRRFLVLHSKTAFSLFTYTAEVDGGLF